MRRVSGVTSRSLPHPSRTGNAPPQPEQSGGGDNKCSPQPRRSRPPSSVAAGRAHPSLQQGSETPHLEPPSRVHMWPGMQEPAQHPPPADPFPARAPRAPPCASQQHADLRRTSARSLPAFPENCFSFSYPLARLDLAQKAYPRHRASSHQPLHVKSPLDRIPAAPASISTGNPSHRNEGNNLTVPQSGSNSYFATSGSQVLPPGSGKKRKGRKGAKKHASCAGFSLE